MNKVDTIIPGSAPVLCSEAGVPVQIFTDGLNAIEPHRRPDTAALFAHKAGLLLPGCDVTFVPTDGPEGSYKADCRRCAAVCVNALTQTIAL